MIGTSSEKITAIRASTYRIPTDRPEADGTFKWNHTTAILVEIDAGGETGLGMTYGAGCLRQLILDTLAPRLQGQSPFDIPMLWRALNAQVRNIGRPAMASMAIAAVDFALWDLKAKILDVSLLDLLGAARPGVPVYGSGGFTSYSIEELQEQLASWASSGMRWVKMKIGTDPDQDHERVSSAREAIGMETGLFVDANGAYSRKQALEFAEIFHAERVSWFEEPVSSDDLEGLRYLRDHAPAGMEIAAGEYGYDAHYFRTMLEAGAVDVLQVDATRCGGISGFQKAASLCHSRNLRVSAHTAPSMHAAICCATPEVVHLEYFHDHARIERMIFDGALEPSRGVLAPDRSRPGFGLELKRADLEKWAA